MPNIKTTAPQGVPMHIALAHFSGAAPETVELTVTVSDRVGVKQYGFAYDRSPVPMNGGRGKFYAVKGAVKLLEWVMIGDGGGTMKVTVKRGSEVVTQREKSTIPPSETRAYDALKIAVA